MACCRSAESCRSCDKERFSVACLILHSHGSDFLYSSQSPKLKYIKCDSGMPESLSTQKMIDKRWNDFWHVKICASSLDYCTIFYDTGFPFLRLSSYRFFCRYSSYSMVRPALTGCILQSMTLPANEIKIVKDSINDKIENIIVNYIASGTPSDSFTNELENEVKKARDHIQ